MKVPPPLASFWAKTSDDSEERPNAFHPLICHLIDVACVAQAMWDISLPETTKRRLAKPFGLENDLDRAGTIVSFFAGLHDLGKASPPFALRGKLKPDSDQTNRLCSLYADTDCDCEGFRVPHEVPHGFVTAITLPKILERHYGFPYPFAKQIAEIIGGHHGLFATVSDFQRIEDYGDTASIGDAGWDRSRREMVATFFDLMDVAFETSRFEPRSLDKPTAMILAGFVSVADWIGSNTDHFTCRIGDSTEPLELDLDEYLESSKSVAAKAIDYLGWNKWPNNTAIKEFDELFDFGEGKRDLQKKAIDIAKDVTGPGIFVVEALMGEGKTETAMFLADYMNATLGTRGIYFALPTQATSDQMFGRVSSFLERRFEESGDFVNLMLQHGHASLSDEFSANVKEFRRLRNIYADDKMNPRRGGGTIAAAEWFTYRKRGLLAPFGVGTIDQILLAALQTKHVFVRLFGLANKTVIIDEVHAYDAYMSTLLGRLLEWLGALGSPVVILSATLPKHRRTELIDSYLRGLGDGRPSNSRPSVGSPDISKGSGDAPDDTPSDDRPTHNEDIYPRISYAFEGMPANEHFRIARLETAAQNVRTIALEFLDEETLIGHLTTKLGGGGCAAIICNTVRRAQELYDLLKSGQFFSGEADDGSPRLDLLHSRFRLKDRQLREKRALLRFGKEDSTVPFTEGGTKVDRSVRRPDMAVLISTQIIEQSLDLDFDLMVSDLAPADLLLQRAGRLQRHRRPDRLPAFIDPTTGNPHPSLWILRPPLDESDDIIATAKGVPDLGDSGLIYDHHILLRSWFTLRNRVTIDVPAEVEEIIEKIYGDELAEDLSEFESEIVAATRSKYLAEVEKEKRIAETRYIKHPHFRGKLGELLLRPREEDSPDLHPDRQAMTRLIEPTCQVACLWEKDGVFYTDDTFSFPVNLIEKPGRDLVKEIILNSVSVSSRSVVFRIFEQPVCEGFRLSPLLRRYRYLVFDSGRKSEFADHVFELHPYKGLLIYKKEDQ